MTTPNEMQEFTEQELQFICGACFGLTVRDIAERCKIGEDIVQRVIYQEIFDKAAVSNRMALYRFVKAALNGELRRRSTQPR